MKSIRSNAFKKMMDSKEMEENYKIVRKDGRKLFTGRKLKTMASVNSEIKDLIKTGEIKSKDEISVISK